MQGNPVTFLALLLTLIVTWGRSRPLSVPQPSHLYNGSRMALNSGTFQVPPNLVPLSAGLLTSPGGLQAFCTAGRWLIAFPQSWLGGVFILVT